MSPADHDHISVGDLVLYRQMAALVVKKGDWSTIIRWVDDQSEEDLWNYSIKDIEVINESR